MKTHPEFGEKWLQGIIAQDPKILGLGDVVHLSTERRQPRAGRLDLLLRELDGNRRYEVEIQLGAVDETHIIRTIEYWDIERKRFPQYDHCAVIIAEEITARFLNVISLFNGHIPLIAIQAQAISVNGSITLVFTKVLDELTRGDFDEEEEAQLTRSDRAQWLRNIPGEIMTLTDKLFKSATDINSNFEPNYTKTYVGVLYNKIASNFILLKPQKKSVLLHVALPNVEEYTKLIDDSGCDSLPYDNSFKFYRLIVRPSDIDNRIDALSAIICAAHKERFT